MNKRGRQKVAKRSLTPFFVVATFVTLMQPSLVSPHFTPNQFSTIERERETGEREREREREREERDKEIKGQRTRDERARA